jgi:hypothetical protein
MSVEDARNALAAAQHRLELELDKEMHTFWDDHGAVMGPSRLGQVTDTGETEADPAPEAAAPVDPTEPPAWRRNAEGDE